MIFWSARIIFAAYATAVLAPVPVYPGASVEADRLVLQRKEHPELTMIPYCTRDSFARVSAFYKSQLGSQADPVTAGLSKPDAPLAKYYIHGTTVDIEWTCTVSVGGKNVKGTEFTIETAE